MNESYHLYYGGGNHGPYVLSQIRTMWFSGRITADAMYWHEGENEWKPLSELLAGGNEASPPPLPMPEYAGAKTASHVEEERLPVEEDVTPRPWRRYCARIVDDTLVTSLLVTMLCLFTPGSFTLMGGMPRNEAVSALNFIVPVVLGFCLLVCEPVLLAAYGTTPGKWMCGLRVTREGRRLPYGAALARFFRLMFYVYVPFLSIVTIIFGYFQLAKHGETLWDRKGGSSVSYTGRTQWTWLAVVCVYSAVLYWTSVPKILPPAPAAAYGGAAPAETPLKIPTLQLSTPAVSVAQLAAKPAGAPIMLLPAPSYPADSVARNGIVEGLVLVDADYLAEREARGRKAYPEALENAKKVAVRYPGSGFALWALSSDCRHTKNYQGALSVAQRCVELFPADVTGWYQVGINNAAMDKWNDAISALERATKLAPSNAAVWRELAKTYEAAGRKEEARNASEHAGTARP